MEHDHKLTSKEQQAEKLAELGCRNNKTMMNDKNTRKEILNMEKFARLVFEEPISEDAKPDEIVALLKKQLENYLESGVDINDIEISENSYERME